MNKHTPGPWGHWIDAGKYVVTGPSAAHAMVAEKAIRNSDHLGAGWRDSFHVLSHIGRVPALALGDSEEEAKANARLIAAAPELLEALKGLTHALDFYDLLHDDQRRFFNAAMEAIAKATGETQ